MNDAVIDKAFVGREEELARLDGFWRSAADGRGQVCLVTGEPGAGKSALLSAFRDRLRTEDPDTQVVDGDCNPQTGTTDAFLPFRELLSELTGLDQGSAAAANPALSGSFEGADARSERYARWLTATRNILQEHGPDLVDIFVPGGALITRLGTQAAGRLRRRSDGPGLEQRHLLEQYTNVIRRLAVERPLVLMVDDLHWADEASILLFFHLARRIEDRSVLLVGAYRATEVDAGRDGAAHPLASVVNELQRYRGGITIDLGETQRARGRDFIDRIIDQSPNRLGRRFREALLRYTGGHALFTVETLQHLRERGILKKAEDGRWEASGEPAWDALPARVEGLIRERIDRLSSAQRRLLEAAAVLGEQFHVEPLASMLDETPRAVRESLSGDLARRHQLVSPGRLERIDGLRLARYAFRHNLIHGYLYGQLDDIERPALHERAGEALVALAGDGAEELAVQLARHFDLAELPERAAPYFAIAGARALRALAHEEARRHYEQVLRCAAATGAAKHATGAGPLRPPGSRPGKEAGEDTGSCGAAAREAQFALGQLDLMDGAFAAARARFEALLADADEDPVEQARLLHEVAVSHEREHDHVAALARLAEGLERLGPAPDDPQTPEARLVLEHWLSLQLKRQWLYYWQGNLDGMKETLAALEDPLERHGTLTQRRNFHTGMTGMGNRRDRFLPSAETLASAGRALALAQESGRAYDQADSGFALAFTQMLSGDLAAAVPSMDDALANARRCGDRTLQARTLAYRVMLSRMRHDEERLRADLADAHALCRELGMKEYVALLRACEAWLAWRAGDPALARDHAEAALTHWRENASGYPFKWLAELPCLALDVDAGTLTEAAERAGRMVAKGQALLGNRVSAALETATSLDADRDEAALREALEEAVKRARAFGYL